MKVIVNVSADTALAAARRDLPIHICISGSDNNLARAVTEFHRAAA